VTQPPEPRAPAVRELTGLRRGLAVPCFTADLADIIGLGLAAEQGGFDGFFLWDHLVHDDTGAGPPVLDPWPLLAVLASQTARIRLGTLITPVPRRRPWRLARETVTVDRLSGGRLVLGVGIGSPPYADFGIFHEPTSSRARAALLDEGLEVLTGLWTGGRFAFSGEHFTLEPVRFRPVPVQRGRF
jgi:alkanesulfonate monooxygenase SsuD/methylene tetrahydromethanopterin reductase-like flavin-dependent oxidoreductase (luciferase family)